MTTKAEALDKLIDAIAGEDVPMTSQTVAGRLDTLADTLAGDDVTFTARDIAGRISQLAGMIEDGTISIGGGSGDKWQPAYDGDSHLWINVFDGQTITLKYYTSSNANGVISWGDGTVEQAPKESGTHNATHTYNSAGLYDIRLHGDTSIYPYSTNGTSDSSTPGYMFNDPSILRYAEIVSTYFENGLFINHVNLKKAAFVNELPANRLKNCFNGCSNLEEVIFSNNTTLNEADATFNECNALKKLTGINAITSMGNNFFYRDFVIEELPMINCNVSSSAFFLNVALKSIVLGENVQSINDYAFGACSNLATITIHAATPPTLSSKAFSYCNNITDIYVPAESVDAYNAATNWSTYASKIQAIPA